MLLTANSSDTLTVRHTMSSLLVSVLISCASAQIMDHCQILALLSVTGGEAWMSRKWIHWGGATRQTAQLTAKATLYTKIKINRPGRLICCSYQLLNS